MKLTTVLFDLDGTLLPMDQETFVKEYFGRISAKLAPQGYEPRKLVETIWRGTGAMVENNGSKTNEEVFWEVATTAYGDRIIKDKHLFDEFYEEEFGKIKTVCGHHPAAAEIVHGLKEKGYRVVLATNPIFPQEPPNGVSSGQASCRRILNCIPHTKIPATASRTWTTIGRFWISSIWFRRSA